MKFTLISRLSCVFYLFSITSALDEYKYDVDSVIIVHIVHMHGHRNQMPFCPIDPDKDNQYWPQEPGALTSIGMKQMYELGKLIRNRYQKLLPEIYRQSDVLVRSADSDITIMSAQSNLAGMYPSSEPFERGVEWQPVPVFTIPEEPLFGHMKELYQLLQTSKGIFEELNREVSIHCIGGTDTHTPVTIDIYIHLWHKVAILLETFKYNLPSWAKTFSPKMITDAAASVIFMHKYNVRMKILNGDVLLADIVNNTRQHILNEHQPKNPKPVQKLYIRSGYASTVRMLLETLHLFKQHIPVYASAVFVELHKSPKNDYFVAVLYRNDTSHPPYLLQLPNCSVICPIENFLALKFQKNSNYMFEF